MTPALEKIQTERLRLRRFRADEAELVFRLMSDPLVMRFYPATYDRARARLVLEKVLAAYERLGYSMLAVERKLDGAFLGQIGLLHWDDVDGREDVEVAYMLLPQHWGAGYATEAARACRDWAFTYLDVDRVVSFIVTGNRPSIAVARRNGMRRLKRLESNRFGKPIYIYGVSRADWPACTEH
ncbi:MAG: GNAT family N-acetyltransferase [Candidatus Eremiobacteraeota bacterium]|nr:GNAT family N-acetyltransferase [Candidatus Eremiobacteraeota bacterium]